MQNEVKRFLDLDADDRAAISSFLYFERDPHDPSDVDNDP
jgi:hypothetical protein